MVERKTISNDSELLGQARDARSRGAHDAAVEILSRLVSSDSNNIDALFLLGASLFSLNKPQEAARCFRKVLKQRPQNEPASLGLFHSLWKLGNRRGAYREMRRFLAISNSREYEQLLSDIDAAFAEAEK